MKYRIYNRKSGMDLGAFEATSEDDAIERMAQDAGYENRNDMDEQVPEGKDNIKAVLELEITRTHIQHIIEDVLEAKQGEGYDPHDPAVCYESGGLRISSKLTPHPWFVDVECVENWLDTGNSQDLHQMTGAEIAQSIDEREVNAMLGTDDNEDVHIHLVD